MYFGLFPQASKEMQKIYETIKKEVKERVKSHSDVSIANYGMVGEQAYFHFAVDKENGLPQNIANIFFDMVPYSRKIDVQSGAGGQHSNVPEDKNYVMFSFY